MAINTGNHIIRGTYGEITGYISGGRNIIRSRTSLTGERVKDDPAFAGFRKSSDRLKLAAVIAANLYNMIPREQKRFSLYRQLTGEAIKLLKQSKNPIEIVERLRVLYISPLLN
jgi:two-component sensor histidine kinase